MKKIPIILDMDPGADDALAIILAVKSNKFDIKGITIEGGNISNEQCAINAAKVLTFLGVDIPIYKGSYRPLVKTPYVSDYVHGKDGLGNCGEKYSYNKDLIQTKSSYEFILETLENEPDLVIIATGPLTNIAKCLSMNRTLMSGLKHLYWMGGAFTCPGNVTPVAEFNAYADSLAAKEVLDFSIPNTIVGLDVTMKLMLPKELLDDYVAKKNKVALFCDDILRAYFEYDTFATNKPQCCLHDPLIVLICLFPELVRKKELYKVEVCCEGITDGQTIIDRRAYYRWHNPKFIKYYEKEKENLMKFGLCEQMPNSHIIFDLDFKEALNKFVEIIFN